MEARAKLHLREWLIVQIDSGRYEGLGWEDEDKSMFRIPWKHAAKKDYRQREDAALFKAWAVYKGKYREGRDLADPTMWKTRLRCALNKSSDFEEVPERNQLDITEPYKVYRILQEPREESMQRREVKSLDVLDSEEEDDYYQPRESTDSLHKERTTGDPLREHMYCEVKENTSANLPQASVSFFSHGNNISDVRMHVTLLYQGVAVMRATTRSPDGCFILQGTVPPANEKIYGSCTAQQLSFPCPANLPLPPGLAQTMDRLLCHLERGVLLWVAPDGVFIKRFCQGRVYWSGPLAIHAERPNKLERDKTFKLLDVPLFRSQLQRCVQQKGPLPSYKIELCFGEEYPDPNVPKAKKLIMAEVVPVFAEELLQQLHLQDSGDTGDTEDRSTESHSQSETEH